ncbi:hypothetical protein BD779DRAFT_1792138 [Infundibulicybe gibba]|nr:hypothetical protein BD779DRAFT_1792138 [Infundibulicybe gibba]
MIAIWNDVRLKKHAPSSSNLKVAWGFLGIDTGASSHISSHFTSNNVNAPYSNKAARFIVGKAARLSKIIEFRGTGISYAYLDAGQYFLRFGTSKPNVKCIVSIRNDLACVHQASRFSTNQAPACVDPRVLRLCYRTRYGSEDKTSSIESPVHFKYLTPSRSAVRGSWAMWLRNFGAGSSSGIEL